MFADKMDPKLLEVTKLALSPFMKCNFTPESLNRLERVIESQFPIEQRAQFPTTYIPFAIYLGETIVRNIPEANWKVPAEERKLFDAAITVPLYGTEKIAEMLPFNRVMKFFQDRTDGLKVWYDLANVTALGMMPNLEQGKVGEWSEWKDNPGGMKFRFKKVPKEGDKE